MTNYEKTPRKTRKHVNTYKKTDILEYKKIGQMAYETKGQIY